MGFWKYPLIIGGLMVTLAYAFYQGITTPSPSVYPSLVSPQKSPADGQTKTVLLDQNSIKNDVSKLWSDAEKQRLFRMRPYLTRGLDLDQFRLHLESSLRQQGLFSGIAGQITQVIGHELSKGDKADLSQGLVAVGEEGLIDPKLLPKAKLALVRSLESFALARLETQKWAACVRKEADKPEAGCAEVILESWVQAILSQTPTAFFDPSLTEVYEALRLKSRSEAETSCALDSVESELIFSYSACL